MMSVDEKIQHLKNIGITGDFSEIRNMYQGLPFNTEDSVYKKIIEVSWELCNEFTRLSSYLIKGGVDAENAKKRKLEIIDILFPGHGMVFGGGDGLKAVIGLVDLDGMNYINTRVDFGKSALVHLGEYVFVANNVSFGGNDNFSHSGKLSKIDVLPNTWICAGVNIEDGVIVGGNSVVTIGSVITKQSNTFDSTIISGNPAQSKHSIIKGFNSPKNKLMPQRTDSEIRAILQHIKNLGISGDFKHYIRQLNNQEYNALDPTSSKIFELSHNLCSEYNDRRTSIWRKKEILDILFFMHGTNLQVGDSLFCDVLGTVKVGNNVRIGNNVALCGNIELSDNVILQDNCLLQAIGHRVFADERKLTNDENGNICEFNVPSFIRIVNNIILAKGTKVAKGIVNYNTTENEIIR